MPYIAKNLRGNILATPIGKFVAEDPATLTYALYVLCKRFLPDAPGEARWRDLSDVVKALECAKLEFYRREVAPYEDAKIADPKNGDVF